MTWAPETTIHHEPVREYTDEELRRYATYHFLETDEGAHVWRTIGGYCEYLGDPCKPGPPTENRPLYPSLEQPPGPSGPVPSAGGVLPYEGKEES